MIFVLSLAEESVNHDKYAKQLKVPLVMGCRDKLSVIEQWRSEMGLEWTQIAFMGE